MDNYQIRPAFKTHNNVWKNPKNASFAAPHPFFRELIIGGSDCGKTTYLKWIVDKEIHLYTKVIIIGPHVLKKHGLRDIINKYAALIHKVYVKFTKEYEEHFYRELECLAEQDQKTLVIVDDPIGFSVFTKAVNQESRWNAMMTGTKHMNVGIKFSVQGEGGLSPIARAMCERIVRYPDSADIVKMQSWCNFLDTPDQLRRLIKAYAAKEFHAVVFCKFRGLRALYKIDPSLKISPITDFPLDR